MKTKTSLIICLTLMLSFFTTNSFAQKNSSKKDVVGAYLEITLKVNEADRASAAGIYVKYKEPFLKNIKGAVSKELLIRADDIQVLHGFRTQAEAEAYLQSELFQTDVVVGLKPFLQADPGIRIYNVFKN